MCACTYACLHRPTRTSIHVTLTMITTISKCVDRPSFRSRPRLTGPLSCMRPRLAVFTYMYEHVYTCVYVCKGLYRIMNDDREKCRELLSAEGITDNVYNNKP